MRLVENEVGERDLYPAQRVEVRADVDQLLDQGRRSGIRLAHDASSRRDQHLHGPGGRPDQRVLPESVVGDRWREMLPDVIRRGHPTPTDSR